MKRARMWLRELTLTQQLLTIIFLFVTIFAGFVFVFLTPAIDRFSETEMYRILHNSQVSTISYMEEHDGEIPYFDVSIDSFVTEAVYYSKTDSFHYISGTDITPDLQADIRFKAAGDFAGTQDFKLDTSVVNASGEYIPVSYLYSLTKYSENSIIVSVIANEYRIQFRQSLVNGVVTMNILFVSVLFVLLMIWVSTLIVPLSQIKTYVTKVKNDENGAELNIRRNDEIGEVADALRDMKEELDRQNHEKEEMIQNISHDLKTPIATIKSYGESIKDGIYPYETLEKSVDVIIEHADRLEKKVRSLIILNKMGYLLDEGEEGDHLNMARVIDKAVLSLKVVRPEISFIKEMDDAVLFHGDEEPWRIVVENLIDNALRYAETYIRITLKDCELCVINDGSKIAPEQLDTLFKPYEKGSNGQFGLGLSIVYRVATTYGYHVAAENLTDGVCFRIWKERPKREKRRSEKKQKKEQS